MTQSGREKPFPEFRDDGRMLVPYRKIINRINDDGCSGPLPIVNVRIGPTLHEELEKQAVRNLVEKHGRNPEIVLSSRVPYRAW
jgi:hypothetical protein